MDQKFSQKIITLRGEEGQKWLEELPGLIKFYEEKWQIKCAEPFHLSHNYVAPAKTIDGRDVVLKISFPDNTEFFSEIAALRFYNGQGAIAVLQHDEEHAVALLERAMPGKRIGDVEPDEKQISILCEVMRGIHQLYTNQSQLLQPLTLLDWANAFKNYKKKFDLQTGPIVSNWIERAEDVFIQYSKQEDQVLLHGDLHNDNILSSDRGWLIIDPKGVIGDPVYDIGTYLRNPIADFPKGTDYKKVLIRRIDQIASEMKIDKQRIIDWTFANAVISLLWFLEDEKKVNEVYLRNAEMIEKI